MNKVSSIRWNDVQLYEYARAYVAFSNQKMNTLIMNAVSEYLRNHKVEMSKLKLQTQIFTDNFNIEEWSNNQDTSGWE